VRATTPEPPTGGYERDGTETNKQQIGGRGQPKDYAHEGGDCEEQPERRPGRIRRQSVRPGRLVGRYHYELPRSAQFAAA